MKLYISRDTSDSTKRFKIFDATGKPFISIESSSSAAFNKLRAYDAEGKVLFKISATPELAGRVGYNVITPDANFAVTVKLKAGELSLRIHGIKLFFRGNLMSHSFEITDVSSTPLATHKPESGKQGCYVLDVFNDSQCLVMLSIAICADILSFSDSAAFCRA